MRVDLEQSIEFEDNFKYIAFGSLNKYFLTEFNSRVIPKQFSISGLSSAQARVIQKELPTDKEGGITFVNDELEIKKQATAKEPRKKGDTHFMEEE